MTSTALVARRALRLEWLSIGWMAVEAVVALSVGLTSHSAALSGFGADSLIELLSAAILVRRLSVEVRGAPAGGIDAAERRAAPWAAGMLGVVVLYLVGAAAWSLLSPVHATPTIAGTVLAALSLGLMVWIARSKRVLGRALGSAALEADGAERVVCAWMAAAALASLGANWVWHWAWVDPMAALAIAYWVAREAREAWEHAHETS